MEDSWLQQLLEIFKLKVAPGFLFTKAEIIKICV